MEDLKQQELLELAKAYSDYIMDFDLEDGSPVCIKEFYENEWEDLKC